MPAGNEEKWKAKYFDSLEELERKEQGWDEQARLLRRAIGRLSHTAYGIHPKLDRQLGSIRDAVKQQRDAAALEQLVRGASESAVEIHDTNLQSNAEVGRLLSKLLDSASLTSGGQRRLSKLKGQLDAIETPEQLLRLTLETLNLVQAGEPDGDARQHTGQPRSEPLAPSDEPGLIGRFFFRKAPKSDGGQADALPDIGWMVDRLLQRIEQAGVVDGALAQLHDQAANCIDRQSALDVLDRVAGILAELSEAAAQPEAQPMAAAVSAGYALRELLQQIEIPADYQARLEAIKSLLSDTVSAQQIDQAVDWISQLLESVRREVQAEKLELERFLEGVTNRIRSLSENLGDLDTNHQASGQARAKLQRDFHDRMNGIRIDVKASQDVQRLKLAIEGGLDAIEGYMDGYIVEEEKRSREASDKIEELSSRLHDMKHEAFQLQQQMADERELAHTDPLTAIANRLAFDERLGTEMQRWKRYGEPLSLLLVDIDFFKRINDDFGHLAGDKALKTLATRLRQNIREVDMVARYGGEEFVIVMPNTALDAAFGVAEKLRQMVQRMGFHYDERPVAITVSGGLAECRDGDDAQSLFKRADDALYAAKTKGRNNVQRGAD